ncbi:MAG TPA: hypothetical protein VFF73_32345 [Planctomycetota bacterium]|nr:hypothetical protein [Planctomycetota bacterium]
MRASWITTAAALAAVLGTPVFAEDARPDRIDFKISQPLSHTKGLPDGTSFFDTYTIDLDAGTFTTSLHKNGRLVGSMLAKLRDAVGHPASGMHNTAYEGGPGYYVYLSGHGTSTTLSGPVAGGLPSGFSSELLPLLEHFQQRVDEGWQVVGAPGDDMTAYYEEDPRLITLDSAKEQLGLHTEGRRYGLRRALVSFSFQDFGRYVGDFVDGVLAPRTLRGTADELVRSEMERAQAELGGPVSEERVRLAFAFAHPDESEYFLRPGTEQARFGAARKYVRDLGQEGLDRWITETNPGFSKIVDPWTRRMIEKNAAQLLEERYLAVLHAVDAEENGRPLEPRDATVGEVRVEPSQIAAIDRRYSALDPGGQKRVLQAAELAYGDTSYFVSRSVQDQVELAASAARLAEQARASGIEDTTIRGERTGLTTVLDERIRDAAKAFVTPERP